jgi:uroporphyrin-III C-methyltransferase
MKKPKLTLVGAGPGDEELITLKGIKALASADVVLYDALVNPDLLSHAPESAPKIFVGKRKGAHKFKQEEINELIVENAYQYGHVVRLKGGDPFIFGRGTEEILHAQAQGIETAYVPGISSSYGVPGIAGIPVTHRGSSESFWAITATTKTGELSKDVFTAAKSDATIVILMGVSKLQEITDVYQSYHRNTVPVAIVQNGSLPNQKVVLGTIDTIEQAAIVEEITGPAVIVIGEVVRLHPDFGNVAAKGLSKFASK